MCDICLREGQKELPAGRGLLNKRICYETVVVGSLTATSSIQYMKPICICSCMFGNQ